MAKNKNCKDFKGSKLTVGKIEFQKNILDKYIDIDILKLEKIIKKYCVRATKKEISECAKAIQEYSEGLSILTK